MTAPAPAIVWFRDDLRLADNPALSDAVATARPILPLYILEEDGRPLGGAARWWLHGSLTALALALAAQGVALLLRRGAAAEILSDLTGRLGAASIHWNARAEPKAAARDDVLAARLRAGGIEVAVGPANLLAAPETGLTRDGRPFRLFAPFWRALQLQGEPLSPLPAPAGIVGYHPLPKGDSLDQWRLRPSVPDWATGLAAAWQPGEAAAQDRLGQFLDTALASYAALRDRVDRAGTSLLSPHLRWGEIGARQVWHVVKQRARARQADAEAFLRQLAWRDFSYHLLRVEPDLAVKPLQAAFVDFPWRRDRASLHAWQRGRTGYPLVDAAMRELWRTGWMANRLRMVVASFLVKHLLLPWQEGEAWFWDTLVDADPANNAANWQWIAGSGSDAAPFFRIFNPVAQAQKFDPEGHYVRRWLPELAALPRAQIHEPWKAGALLSRQYPAPIVEHGAARARALDAFATWRKKGR